jgi:predicted RNA-binding Zn-ribbon protein involved in translation (DUF1610 family)
MYKRASKYWCWYFKWKNIGKIDIQISNRALKRYGCCKQETPDKKYKTVKKYRYRKVITYQKFEKHHICISKWVLELDDKIIKNTIIHELIHCIPYCNDHGENFKNYANYINEKLGYNISRLGNKEEDYKKSNIEYKEKERYNYIITCDKCGQKIYRKRLNKDFVNKYKCGICKSKFKVEIINWFV